MEFGIKAVMTGGGGVVGSRRGRPWPGPPGPGSRHPIEEGPGIVPSLPASARGREIGARPQIPGTKAAPVTIMMMNDYASMIPDNPEVDRRWAWQPAGLDVMRPTIDP